MSTVDTGETVDRGAEPAGVVCVGDVWRLGRASLPAGVFQESMHFCGCVSALDCWCVVHAHVCDVGLARLITVRTAGAVRDKSV